MVGKVQVEKAAPGVVGPKLTYDSVFEAWAVSPPKGYRLVWDLHGSAGGVFRVKEGAVADE